MGVLSLLLSWLCASLWLHILSGKQNKICSLLICLGINSINPEAFLTRQLRIHGAKEDHVKLPHFQVSNSHTKQKHISHLCAYTRHEISYMKLAMLVKTLPRISLLSEQKQTRVCFPQNFAHRFKPSCSHDTDRLVETIPTTHLYCFPLRAEDNLFFQIEPHMRLWSWEMLQLILSHKNTAKLTKSLLNDKNMYKL